MSAKSPLVSLQEQARAVLPQSHVHYAHAEKEVHGFDVTLAGETVQVTFNARSRAFRCTCQGYDAKMGSCLHVEVLKLWRAQQERADGAASNGSSSPVSSSNGSSANGSSSNGRPMPPPPVPMGSTNGKPPKPGTSGAAAQPSSAQPSANDGPAPAEAPSVSPKIAAEVAEMAARTLLPWGKFKGVSLAQLAATPEGHSYLFFLARKSEPKNDADRNLTAAADKVLLAVVELEVALAEANPDQAMPVLPFGEEKDKQLHKAHPKWTAILAKKSDEDARSYQDLVLYRVAQALNAKRGGHPGHRYSPNGLTTDQFEQLLAELRGIRAALEKAVFQ